jgi:sirohydrochlorin cobaltochelatase
MTNISPKHGVILFGHGSRDPLWHKPMQAVAERARQLDPQAIVHCAYLELTPPDLPACVVDMAAAGVQSIAIVPMFLGVGRHAREDLPRIVMELKTRYPHISFHLREAVGEDSRVINLLASITLGDE